MGVGSKGERDVDESVYARNQEIFKARLTSTFAQKTFVVDGDPESNARTGFSHACLSSVGHGKLLVKDGDGEHNVCNGERGGVFVEPGCPASASSCASAEQKKASSAPSASRHGHGVSD